MVLATALVLCPTVGGAVGAALNVSATEVAEAREVLERIGREHPFGDGLRGELAHRLVREAPHYAVALLAPDGTDPLGAPVDAVVALNNPTVTLLSYRKSKIRTDGEALTLYAWVDAEVRRPDTNAVLHRARIEYWGERFSFMDWGAAGGERLALGLASAQRSLAEHLAQHFFQVQTPTAMKRTFCANQPWSKRWERSRLRRGHRYQCVSPRADGHHRSRDSDEGRCTPDEVRIPTTAMRPGDEPGVPPCGAS